MQVLGKKVTVQKISDRVTYPFWVAMAKYRAIAGAVAEVEGIKLQMGPHISTKVQNAIYGGKYEEEEVQILKSHLSDDDIIMELGTGLGLVSSYCAKHADSKNVFTFEANPSLEAHIRQNFELNNVSPSLQICLLGEEEGEQNFYLMKDFWSSSTERSDKDKLREIVKIPVKSFNKEIQRIDPTFLILDIEGGEYDLFQYATLHNVQKILIELHPYTIGEEKSQFVKNKLADAGFKVVDVYPHDSGNEVLLLHRVA
jgi:FkbM family methyltransferase